MTAPRSPREVLADVIAPWVEDEADLYGYVDTLINALDKAGWEIVWREEAGPHYHRPSRSMDYEVLCTDLTCPQSGSRR